MRDWVWRDADGRGLGRVDLRMISHDHTILWWFLQYCTVRATPGRFLLKYGTLHSSLFTLHSSLFIGRLGSACFPWHANASRVPRRPLPNLERLDGCCSAAAAYCSTAITARSRAAESGCWLPSSGGDHKRSEQVSLAPVQLHPPTRPRCYVGGCVVALRSLADVIVLFQIAQAPACDALSGCGSRPRLLALWL